MAFVKKKLKTLFAFLLLIQTTLFVNAAAYDLTIYRTVDNSVMGVKENKLGLDITGYMFVGESAQNGLYFRLGVQTPFDTILGYLNLFNEKLDAQEKIENTDIKEEGKKNEDKEVESTIKDSNNTIPDSSLSLDETSVPPIEDLPLPDIEKEAFSPDSSILDNTSPSIDDVTIPVDKDKENTLENEETIEKEESGDQKQEISVGEGNTSVDTSQTTVVKGSTTKNTFNKEWRLLFTFGPAKRRFMGESAIVYLGYGLSGDIGHKFEVEKDTKYTVVSSYAVVGADLDFGMRYNLKANTSIRVGVHFTASLIGVKSKNILNTKEENIYNNIDIYGYSLSERGIFETLSGKGYMMLATALGFNKKTTYNYSNTTKTIGGGTITVN